MTPRKKPVNRQNLPDIGDFVYLADYTSLAKCADSPAVGEKVSHCFERQPVGRGNLGLFRRAVMFKTAVLSVLGLVAGMVGSVANAQYVYSPYGYSDGVRSVYFAPVVVARPVYVTPVYVTPVVQTVYSSPVVYSSPISTVSYSSLEPTPVYSEPTVSYYQPAPVYVAPAPVFVSSAVYSPVVVRESLTVRPFSTTYRAHGYGSAVYSRSTPHRTVVRTRGW